MAPQTSLNAAALSISNSQQGYYEPHDEPASNNCRLLSASQGSGRKALLACLLRTLTREKMFKNSA